MKPKTKAEKGQQAAFKRWKAAAWRPERIEKAKRVHGTSADTLGDILEG